MRSVFTRPLVGVGAKGVVVHQKGLVAVGQLAHALGHVHAQRLARSVAGAQDLVGPWSSPATLRGRRASSPKNSSSAAQKPQKEWRNGRGNLLGVGITAFNAAFCEDGWQKTSQCPFVTEAGAPR